jgi:hypothetical protein
MQSLHSLRVIRHVDVNYINENLTDKLRLHIYKLDDLKIPIGKKDVPLTLIANKLNADGCQLNTSAHGNKLGSMMNSNQQFGSNMNSSHASQSLFSFRRFSAPDQIRQFNILFCLLTYAR